VLPPGYRHLMLMFSAQNTDLDTMMAQMLQCHWWLWRSDLYHLLSMCHVYIDIRMYVHRQFQVLWDLKLIQFFWGPLWEKEYKIEYRGEYLFRPFPRALEKACV